MYTILMDYFIFGRLADGDLSRFAPDSTHPDKLALDAIMGRVHGH